MGNKSKVKTRKGQLIHTFGPGAMQVNKNGISMITCGLDHWFEDNLGMELSSGSIKKFTRYDKRLQNKLNVETFRVPPDFNIIEEGNRRKAPIPAKRFPLWHVCSNTSCQRLQKGLNEANDESKKFCYSCGAPAYQSRFITLCSEGHIDDFPWFEWLNHYSGGKCSEENGCQLKLEGTGSSSVSNIRVKCIKCNKSAPLRDIFHSELNDKGQLETAFSKAHIGCKSNEPWLGDVKQSNCPNAIVAALRQSTNVYFSKIDSSIHIPQEMKGVVEQVAFAYEQLTHSQKSKLQGVADFDTKISMLSMALNEEFSETSLKEFFEADKKGDELANLSEDEFRFEERDYFLKDFNSETLSIKVQDINKYQGWFSEKLSTVSLIDKLTVTQAMYGFERLTPSAGKDKSQYKSMLWADKTKTSSWLPAVQNHGEGIYIEFDHIKINEWAREYAKVPAYMNLYQRKEENTFLDSFGSLTPQFLLVHSFSHALINRLIHESGYSTASLRERIYVSTQDGLNMFGVLVYTASGDSEGSLGGLVRLGKAGKLESIVKNALSDAYWCSSDPICFETGHSGGQGPSGLNLAACHNCLLLPETSCEVFNSLLDRMTLHGLALGINGYFDSGDI
ncbi:DUF1998 domain-containing protein [Vibrio fluvialis]|uniref:DUF1998 domain-containing protein n=1 Tax=Vibrio fluvialis TaxID=676 RepID=UPI001302210F|nr:DUF1998 domain-containing protein [Vibrio fluvialis]EKO3388948.1 DUF1998 domain-containing protein [Vibrio fluvialis]